LDNVTHAALGLAIAEAGFRGSLGTAGLALALVASELPDIDIFLGIGDPWAMITTHRGITHSVLLVPVVAAALAGIWSWFSSAGSFRMFFLLAGACLLAHIGLDVLTTYGTRILEPLSSRRFGLGWVAVIDPVVTGVLLAGAIAAWWLRNQNPAAGPRFAQAALLVVAGYFLLGAWMHQRAMRVVHRQTAQLGAPVAADATPQLGTIFLWRLLYRGPDTFWVARYNSLTNELQGAQAIPASLDPQLQPLLATPRVQVFCHFAGQLTRPHVDPTDPNALIVEDMRFSYPTNAPIGLWALRIEFVRNGQDDPQARGVQFLQRQLRPGRAGPVAERVSPVPAGQQSRR